MKAKKQKGKVMVSAPEGYHWMSKSGRYYLMKHKGKFVPHKGASLEMPFKVKIIRRSSPLIFLWNRDTTSLPCWLSACLTL